MKALDVTGERYVRLVALSRRDGKRSPWLWQCDCGNTTVATLESVRGGLTKSCGCLRKDVTRARSLTHGHTVGRKSTPTIKSYQHAKSRCTDINDPKWPSYGGRGITMCDAWLRSFEAFLADMGEAPAGMTIERKDNDLGYTPDNCRWATRADQAKNKQQTVWVEYAGARMCLKDFAKAIGVNYKTLHAKVRYHGANPLDFA